MTEQEEFYFQKTVVKDLHIKKLLTDIAQLRMRVGMIESEYDEIEDIKRKLLKANRDEVIIYLIENMQTEEKETCLVEENRRLNQSITALKNELINHKNPIYFEGKKKKNNESKGRYYVGWFSDRKTIILQGKKGELLSADFSLKCNKKGFNSIRELKEHEIILDEPCKCCGGLIHKPQLRHEETLFCKHCYYYNITLADLKPYLVIIHDLLLFPKSHPDVPDFILGKNNLISDLIPDHEELNRCYYYIGDITSDAIREIFVTDK